MTKKILAWLPYHLFFWSGHLVSKIVCWAPRGEAGEFTYWLYPLYNWLMSVSVDINDWDDLGYWAPVVVEDPISGDGFED